MNARLDAMARAAGIDASDRARLAQTRFAIVDDSQLHGGAESAAYDHATGTVLVSRSMIDSIDTALATIGNPSSGAASQRAARRRVVKTFALFAHEAFHADQARNGTLERVRAMVAQVIASPTPVRPSPVAELFGAGGADPPGAPRPEDLPDDGSLLGFAGNALGADRQGRLMHALQLIAIHLEIPAQRVQEQLEFKYGEPTLPGSSWTTIRPDGTALPDPATRDWSAPPPGAPFELPEVNVAMHRGGHILEAWFGDLLSGIRNPGEASPGIRNPGIRNPGDTSPGIRNPGETSPGIRNPGEVSR